MLPAAMKVLGVMATCLAGAGPAAFCGAIASHLTTLGAEQAAILAGALGIRSLADLLHYTPIDYARLLRALSSGEIAQGGPLATVKSSGTSWLWPATNVVHGCCLLYLLFVVVS